MNTAYLEMKLAWSLHNRHPSALDAGTREQLAGTVTRQSALESLILASPEAMHAVVSPALVSERLAAIRARYDSDADMHADLATLGLDERGLEEEVRRDLALEATLDWVGSQAQVATETDAEIYVHLHPDRFTQPELRQLRHILITFETPGQRQAAKRQLEALRAEGLDEDAFAAAALRHSHCPTAMEGGLIGKAVPHGKLFPEVEAAAFALAEGELSAVVETEVGLHLLRCDHIQPGKTLGFAEVKQRIVDHLNERRVQAIQKQWVQGLRQAAASRN
jgi:nitrogen fixation protein NifM